MRYPLTDRKVTKGDLVVARLAAYVRDVDHDAGTVDLAWTREPYADPLVEDVPADALLLRDTAPAEPMIGDTITGKTVRETSWRRGTTLVDRTDLSLSEGEHLILAGTGQWVNVDHDGPTVPVFGFDTFGDGELFEVVAAPGKATRPAKVAAPSLNDVFRDAFRQRYLAGIA